MDYAVELKSVFADQREYVDEMNVRKLLSNSINLFNRLEMLLLNFQNVFMSRCNRFIDTNSFEHVNIVHINSLNDFYVCTVSDRHHRLKSSFFFCCKIN